MKNRSIDLVAQSVFNEIIDSVPVNLTSLIDARKRGYADLELLDSTEILRSIIAYCCSEDAGSSKAKVDLSALLNSCSTSSDEWTGNTVKNSRARRNLVYNILGLIELQVNGISAGELIEKFVNRVYDPDEVSVVIEADGHKKWYFGDRKVERFYWDAYRGFQKEKYVAKGYGLSQEALERLDIASDEIVGLLTDPRQAETYNTKGLVVGYVQSGKTTNFSAVITKAVDSGYRIIIVFAGLTNMLRGQTQQRLDKEVVGWEAATDDPEYLKQYQGQLPAKTEFLQHGFRPRDKYENIPNWVRLTQAERSMDFQSLKAGLNALRIPHTNRNQPLNHIDNLKKIDVSFVVVKKNPSVLTKLINDIKTADSSFSRFRDDLPVLIIDDEADQASVNVVNPNSKKAISERTKTNEKITELLGLFRRGQYLAYTATPFANVFIDADDPKDLFPKDFIVSLDRPAGYIGGREFVDLNGENEYSESDYASSNKMAFIRDIVENEEINQADDDSLKDALRAFVLSGALKLYRENHSLHRYAHHTMLIHTIHSVNGIKANQAKVVELWAKLKMSGSGLKDLKSLWETDFKLVTQARGQSLPSPKDFEELEPYIAKALEKIEGEGTKKVAISVHFGEDQDTKHQIDFDGTDRLGRKRSIWKIVCGGNKLSRGYTIEGLTVSYFRRTASADDTRMQMARWFGYRPGYHDLIRLYIGRNEGKNKNIDLYEQFREMCLQEERFREQIRLYTFDSTSKENLTPKKIPPLVQAISGSTPTGRNKMWHTRIVSHGGGKPWWEPLKTYNRRGRNADLSKLNIDLVDKFMSPGKIVNVIGKPLSSDKRAINEKMLMRTSTVVELSKFLEKFNFSSVEAKIENLQRVSAIRSAKADTKVIFLLHTGPTSVSHDSIELSGHQMRLFGRTLLQTGTSESNPRFKAITEPQHKNAANILCGDQDEINSYKIEGFLKDRISSENVVVLLYPVQIMQDRATKSKVNKDYHIGFAIRFSPSIYSSLVYQNATGSDEMIRNIPKSGSKV